MKGQPITIETRTERTVIINGKWIFHLPVETKVETRPAEEGRR